MSATTKVLVIIFAIAAFGIGVVVNSARVSDQLDAQILLSAKLMVAGENQNPISIGQQLSELTLVNFWASWCTPCRKEMPMFESMVRSARSQGFQVIGVAIDSPEKAQPMLDSMDITYPILYAEQTGMELMAEVGNPQGLLPYSLLLNKNGEVLEQILGRIHEQDIVDWLQKYL